MSVGGRGGKGFLKSFALLSLGFVFAGSAALPCPETADTTTSSAKREAASSQFAKAEEMRAAGYTQPVSLSASRAGAVPGTHEIGFDSLSDTITLRHTARSREGFARGALQAARWIAGRRGFFEFKEILGELGHAAAVAAAGAGGQS